MINEEQGITGITGNNKRGTIMKANTIGIETTEIIGDHIKSFPVMKLHYWRKEYMYLDSRLNAKIMYGLFEEIPPRAL